MAPTVIPTPGAGDTPWTNTGALIIAACNFIPSTYVEVLADGGGGLTKQVISNATFTTLTLDVEVSDANNLFASNLYTVPSDGVYFIQALVRIVDGQFAKATWPDGSGIGLGVHTSNIDGSWFQWNKVNMNGVGGSRFSMDYTRIGSFVAGNQLRLYTFSDSGAAQFNTTTHAMQIFRIA